MDIKSIGSFTQPSTAATNAVDTPAPVMRSAAPVVTATAVEQPVQVPTMAQLKQAVASINKAMESMAQGIEFSLDTDSNRTIIKVIDQSTGEVIRQIPDQETLEIAKALDQVQGLLIKQQA